MHISICICTYQRPDLLRRLILALSRQQTGGLFTFEVVIVDNDSGKSGEPIVTELSKTSQFQVSYYTEARRSISLARNRSIEMATGQAIAFIDDDEFPTETWLLNLYNTLVKLGADGVLGPVRPHFEDGAPEWIKKAGLYNRPEHPTGFVLAWEGCRTGNVLFKRELIQFEDPVFDPAFGTGGSDVDFFRRMMSKGHTFMWCNEAIVYESVPPSRWDRRNLIRRALLRGRNSFRHPEGRWSNVGKALFAIPIYVVSLPFLQIVGHHHFMRYLIKLCDHTGRLLAALGVTPIRERTM